MQKTFLQNSKKNTICRPIILSPIARDDLDRILDYYINEIYYPKAANEILISLEKKCSLISEFPNLGKQLKHYGIPSDIRMIISGQYVLIYLVEPECIKILRIADTRTDYMTQLFSDGITVQEE